MPLNYSKWDKIELSDDSDIETHPNIDKASMIRWRQAKIHKDRRDRKDKIAALGLESEMNRKVIVGLKKAVAGLESAEMDSDKWVQRLKTLVMEFVDLENKYDEAFKEIRVKDWDSRWGYITPIDFLDARVVFDKVGTEIIKKFSGTEYKGKSPEELNTDIGKELRGLMALLEKRILDSKAEVEREENESRQKLTSDNIGTVTKDKMSITSAKKQVAIETLNSPDPSFQSGLGGDASAGPAPAAAGSSPSKSASTINPTLVEALVKRGSNMDNFSEYVHSHPEVVSKEYSDEMLAQAFRAENEGKHSQARDCVMVSTALMYIGTLGNQGIGMFFRRMSQKNHEGRDGFFKDVVATYERLALRIKELRRQEEETERVEQEQVALRLQLATKEDGTLELPLSETPSVEELERADVFRGLPRAFQRALLLQDPDEINGFFASVGKDEVDELVEKCSAVGLIEMGDDDDDDKAAEVEGEADVEELVEDTVD